MYCSTAPCNARNLRDPNGLDLSTLVPLPVHDVTTLTEASRSPMGSDDGEFQVPVPQVVSEPRSNPFDGGVAPPDPHATTADRPDPVPSASAGLSFCSSVEL